MADEVLFSGVFDVTSTARPAVEETISALGQLLEYYQETAAKIGAAPAGEGMQRTIQSTVDAVSTLSDKLSRLGQLSAEALNGDGVGTGLKDAAASIRSELTGLLDLFEELSRSPGLSGVNFGSLGSSAVTEASTAVRRAGESAGVPGRRTSGTVRALENAGRPRAEALSQPQESLRNIQTQLAQSTGSQNSKLITTLRNSLLNGVADERFPGLEKIPSQLQSDASLRFNSALPAGGQYDLRGSSLRAVKPIASEANASQAKADTEATAATVKVTQSAEQLAAAQKKLADALLRQQEQEEEANSGPLDQFRKGFVGAGGNRRRGGAQGGTIGNGNPLNGLAETAGVIAKYTILGRALQSVTQFAHESFTEFAALDQQIADYNAVIGSGNAASASFVNNLENISTQAGINVVDALAAATKGVAAFSDSSDTAAQKKQIGTQFTSAAAVNSVITGQSIGTSGNQLTAVAKSFDVGTDSLTQINDAIATAHTRFGSGAADISAGLQLIADDGKAAGYSMTQLASVVALVASRTGESGEEVATNLQRVFSNFQSSAGQTALSTVIQIDPGQTTAQQITALAQKWPTLTTAVKNQTEQALGGAKALKELLPLLSDNADLQKSFTASLNDSGSAQKLANASLGSLAGTIKVIGAEFKQTALDVARTGIFDPLIVGLEALKPLLSTLDTFLQYWDEIANVDPVTQIAAGVIEFGALAAILLKISKFSGLKDVGTSVIGSLGKVSNKAFGTNYGTSAVAADSEAAAKTSASEQILVESATRTATAQEVLAASATTAAEALDALVVAAGAEGAASDAGTAIGAMTGTAAAATKLGGIASIAPIVGASSTSLTGGVAATESGIAGVGSVTASGARSVLPIAAEETAGTVAAAGTLSGAGAIVAPAAALIVDAVFAAQDAKSVSSLNKAGSNLYNVDTSQGVGAGADAAAAAADSLNTADAAYQKKRGSLLGRLATGVRGAAGGTASDAQNADSQQRKANRDIAGGFVQYAKALQDAQGAASSSSTFGLDLSSTNTLSTSLQTLQNTGADPQTIAAAAQAAITAANVSASGKGGLNHVQQLQSAANAGGSFVNDLNIEQGSPALQGLSLDQLNNLSTKGQGIITSETTTALAKNKGTLTPAQQKALADSVKAHVDAQLPDFDKLSQSTQQTINSAITASIATNDKKASSVPISVPTLTAANQIVLQNLSALGTQVGQNLTAASGGDTTKSTLAGDEAQKAALQKLKASDQTALAAQVPGSAAAKDLQAQIQTITDDQTNLANQTITDTASIVTAYGALQAASIQSGDKMAQVNQQLATDTALLAGSNSVANQTKVATDLQTQFAQNLTDNAAQLTDSAAQSAAAQAAATAQADKTAAGASALQDLLHGGLFYQSQNTRNLQHQQLLSQTTANQAQQTQAGNQAIARIDPRNTQALDRQSATNLRAQIAVTTDPNTIATLQAQLASALLQVTKDGLANAQALASANADPQDQAAQTLVSLNAAAATVKTDLVGSTQYGNDLATLHQLQATYAQQQLANAQTSLALASDTTDPAAQAKITLQIAQQKQAKDNANPLTDQATKNTDRLSVENAQQAATQAQFTQNLSLTQSADQLGQISHQAYLTYLKNQATHLQQQMAGMKVGSEGYLQAQTDLNTLGQDILSANQQLTGVFNIGTITVPTPYEVRRSIATAAAGQNYQSSSSSVVINVNGTNYDTVTQLLAQYIGPVTTGQYTLATRKN